MKVMKKIFAEELEKKQQNLLKLISGNFEKTVKEIKNIKNEVNELEKASNLQRSFLKKKFSLEEKVEKIYDYQIDSDKVGKKLTDLEDCSRRNNLRIDGVAEENVESWDNCEQKVKETFMNKIELENNIIIERAHRAKKKQIWQEGSTSNNSV